MASGLIDRAIPEHDANSPRPRGLLPVPPQVDESVACEVDRLARENGIEVTPPAKQRMRDDLVLQYYYEGAYIAYRRTPQGIEVVAVGEDESQRYREEHPPESRMDVRIGVV
jgi:hypothetical protein